MLKQVLVEVSRILLVFLSVFRDTRAAVIRNAWWGVTVTAHNMAHLGASPVAEGRSVAIETTCVALATAAATVRT